MKKALILVAVVVLAVAAVFALDRFLPRSFSIPENTLSVTIQNRQTGDEGTITDPEEIARLRAMFDALEVRRKRPGVGPFGGGAFRVQAFSPEGTVTTILVMGEYAINGTHMVTEGTIDLDELSRLCKEY